MQKINILLFRDLSGGMASYEDGQFRLQFHLSEPGAPLPSMKGAIWAGVQWILPGISGVEVCRRIRSDPRAGHAHITMIIDREDDGVEIRRRALRAGANDYLIGPIDRETVLDRVRTQSLRAHQSRPTSLSQCGELVLDNAACRVSWRGRAVSLMPTQMRLLSFFIQHTDQVFTRRQLIEALNCEDARLDERTADVWIGRLRRALKAVGANGLIRTVRARGYIMEVSKVKSQKNSRPRVRRSGRQISHDRLSGSDENLAE